MEFPERIESRILNQRFAEGVMRRIDFARFPVQRVEAGRWLRCAGDRLLQLPYIEAGRLDTVIQVGEQGTPVVPLTFERGEIAMVSSLFSDQPIAVDLVAGEDVQVRWLPAAEIEAALLADRDLLVLVVRFLAQRLREVQSRERGWLERGVHERVCISLVRVARDSKPGPDGRLLIAATHEQLAQRCGVSRPKLSLELKQLELAGRLKLHRGAIEILDLAALEACA